MKRSVVLSSRDIVEVVMRAIWKHLGELSSKKKKKQKPRLIVMVNNLGSVPALEMSIVSKNVLESVAKLSDGIDVHLISGSLMTALDMNGISVSVLPMDDDEEFKLLIAPAAPHTSFPHVSSIPNSLAIKLVADPLQVSTKECTNGESSVPKSARDAATEAKISSVCNGLIKMEAALNTLDAVVGDGDTGTQMNVGAKSVLKALGSFPSKDLAATCVALSKILFRNMGGSSGVLLSILFQKMGGALSRDASDFNAAFRSGLEAMMEYGGASEGDRTMLDALLPASRAKTLSDAATAAMKGAEATKMMSKANAGRSMYVGASNLKGNMDPGAYAAACALRLLAGA